MKFIVEVKLNDGPCHLCDFSGSESCPCDECDSDKKFEIVNVEPVGDDKDGE